MFVGIIVGVDVLGIVNVEETVDVNVPVEDGVGESCGVFVVEEVGVNVVVFTRVGVGVVVMVQV